MELDPPTPMAGNTYLGCTQRSTIPDPQLITEMLLFFSEITNSKASATDPSLDELQKVPKVALQRPIHRDTLVDSKDKKAGGNPCHSLYKHIQSYEYDMCGHAQGCVDKYCELAKVAEGKLKLTSLADAIAKGG